MKTEEVKYVYQPEAPLLMPKTKNGPVYQETTVKNDTSTNMARKSASCWSGHLFSRFRLVLSCLAIVACLAVIVVLMTKGNDRQQAQEKEIATLKELVENQQSRLHRMQKELQFLVTRQKAYEAKEDHLRRRQLPISSSTSVGTGTGSNIWPSSVDRSFSGNEDGLEKVVLAADSELPLIPRPREQTEAVPISILDDEVDVDKLPRASANKKRKSKMLLDDAPPAAEQRKK